MRRWWGRLRPWLMPVLLVSELVLVWSGLVGVREAVIVAVVVEVGLAMTAVSGGIAGVRRFRAGRVDGKDGWLAAEDGLAQLMPRKAAHVVLLEARIWACLVRVLRSNRQPPRGAYTYSRGLRPLLLVVLGLVVVEGAVVELVLGFLLGNNVWVWIVAALHLYAVVWFAGLIASLTYRPHLVGAHALLLRDSVFNEVTVPYEAIADVRSVTRPNLGRSGFTVDEGSGSALLAYGDATVRLSLRPSLAVRLNGRPTGPLTELAVSADDPAAFVRAVTERATRAVPA